MINARRPGFYPLTVLVAAMVALVFSPVLWNGFLAWDDPDTIANNASFSPPTFAGMERYWRSPAAELYIPVTYTAWAGLAELAYSPTQQWPVEGAEPSHLNPIVFHAASLITHIASTLAVLAILRLLIGQDLPAAMGAAIFALHPVQAETVAWASGLKDLLCGLFTLLAIWNYLIFVKDARRRMFYALAMVCFVLAMLSKPAAVMAPVLAIGLEVFALGGTLKRSFARLWPWLILAAPIVYIGRLAQPGPPFLIVPLYTRPAVALVNVGFYIAKLIAPVRLAVDYALPQDRILSYHAIDCLAILPVVVAVLIWRFGGRRRWLYAGAIAFLAPLAPVIGFARFSYAYYSGVADHYLYLSMFGLALAAAAGLKELAGAGRLNGDQALSQTREIGIQASHLKGPPLLTVIYGLFAAWLLALGLLGSNQVRLWRDTPTLLLHSLQINPASLNAHRILGYIYARRGRISDAVYHDQQALLVRSDDSLTNFNFGNLLLERLHDPAAAIPHYQLALRRRPIDPQLRGNYAVALEQIGKIDEARRQYAIEHVLAGDDLLRRNQPAGAIEQYRRALGIDPSSSDALAGLARAAQAASGAK